jgi:hypothetical protein
MNDVCKTIRSLLERCKIPYSRAVYDDDLDRLTREDLTRRKCPLSDPYGVVPYIPTAVSIAAFAYAHTPRDTQRFVSVYTVFLVYIDDTYSDDASGIQDFNTRFVLGQKQRDTTLQCMAEFIHEIPQRYGYIASNTIITSTLNLITALFVEYKTKSMPVSNLRLLQFWYGLIPRKWYPRQGTS